MIAPLLFLLACAPGELKEGFAPEGPATVDDVTEVTITPEKPSLGTDEMVRIRVRGRTDNGEELTPPMDWTADGGTITQTSNNDIYFSSTSAGSFRVTGRGRTRHQPVDTTTVVVIEPTYSIVSITVSPDPASVIEGLSQTFTASGLRSDGSSASPSVSWSATGGTISSGGVYTAGGTEGDYAVTAVSTENLSDVAAVSVEPAPLQGPNAPTGFTPIFEKNFSSLPGTVGGDLYGASSGLYRGGDTTMTLVQDPSAPFSPSSTLQTRWPKGLLAGSSPGAWWFWNSFAMDAPAYREIYLSFRAKIPTADFENQAVQTKLIYFAHGGDGTIARNDDIIGLRGIGTNSVMPAMEIAFAQSQADDRTGEGAAMFRYQNMTSAKVFTAGAWHHIELYANVGTVDHFDGIVRIWVDGVLVTQYTNLKFLDSRYNYTRGFYEGQWTPVWGGTGGTKTRDDYMLLDHLYLSGRQ